MKVKLLRLLGIPKFKMAAHPKIESKPPKRFTEEVEKPKPCSMRKKPKKDNNLYDIEVTEMNMEKKMQEDSFCWLWKLIRIGGISISTVIS